MSPGREPGRRAERPRRGEAPPQTADEYECSECGSSLDADATKCAVCGQKFEASSPPADTEAPPAEAEGPQTAGTHSRTRVVAAVLGIALVGLLAWGFIQFGRPASPGGPATIVHGTTPTSFPTNSTSHAVSMPAVVNAGDLLVVFLACDGTPNVATPAGWTFFFGWNSWGGPTMKFSMYAKRSNGTEGGTTVDFVTSTAGRAAAQVYRISGWRDSGTVANDVEVNVTGSTDANPDPPALDPTHWGVENTLWIAAYGAEGANNATAFPANYIGGTFTESDSSATAVSLASAHRTAAIGAEDATPFTTSASSFWIACIVAVRLAA